MEGLVDENLILKISDTITIILVCEMILKIYAYNPKRFAKKKLFIIEAIILVVNFIEFIISE